MVLALVSSYQQQHFVSLAELNLDAVTPPKLQGIDVPPLAPYVQRVPCCLVLMCCTLDPWLPVSPCPASPC